MVKTKQGFTTQVAVLKQDMKYSAAGSGLLDPGELAETKLPHLRGGQLFAYLFRRFGYPSWGWDDYKELTHYLITTPREDVFLEVRPYMGGDYPQTTDDSHDRTVHMFGYCVEQGIEREREKHSWWAWEKTPLYKQCMKALEVAMLDLLRPVYIRDVPINCYGRVKDEEFGKLPPHAEIYHAAGYPIPKAFFKTTERWEQFTDALITLGEGSMDKGMDNVIRTAGTVLSKE